MATNVRLQQLALDLVLEEEAFLGMARSLFVPITFRVVRKMLAQVCPASNTFACRRDVWHRLKISCTTSNWTVISGVLGRTTACMVWLMNNGYNFRVGILLVVSEIPLVVCVATLGSLFGSLPSTTNFSESFITSTCSAESFLNQFLASTCSLESIIVSTCLSDWIVHSLNSLTISSRMPAASRLSNDQFASFFCKLLVTGDLNGVSHVILFMLRSISSSS